MIKLAEQIENITLAASKPFELENLSDRTSRSDRSFDSDSGDD